MISHKLLEAVKKERRISLTDLASLYGPSIDIRNTVSDKHLVKRQLELLAAAGDLSVQRDGRHLVAPLCRLRQCQRHRNRQSLTLLLRSSPQNPQR